ncbi:hypothetical protein BDQ17DRAFT_1387786 [Cyathus striatus]|nr:hypothetical protein BDQ17DRAFT_1387786 [Cyathus striatus]
MTSAANSILPLDAPSQTADGFTSNANEITNFPPFGFFPSYLHNLHDFSNSPDLSSVLSFTLSASPWFSPPPEILNDPLSLSIIQNHPHLFKIVTPINVSLFEHLLLDHPNTPFTQSVCQGLREGFWPPAVFPPSLPPTYDVSDHHPTQTLEQQHFLSSQCAIEIQLECFSPAFGPDLLPVSKKESGFRMITNHSARSLALNSFFPPSTIKGRSPFDSLHHLGNALLSAQELHPDVPLTLFKSDVKSAYQLIPMHPFWQIKQIVTFTGHIHHVDCNNVFSDSMSAPLWLSFMSLVIWIATFMFALPDLFLFMDDVFSFDIQTNSSWYPCYRKLMPAKQTALLSLWDDLGIPHEERKQIFGSSITIIGFYQSLMGWINWVLNIAPLLRPALSAMYHKTVGKSCPSTPLWINKSIQGDLLWFLNHFSHSLATLHIEKSHWSLSSAFIIYVDACPMGLGIWMSALNHGFTSQVDFSPPSSNIFFLESLAVTSAIHIVSSLIPHGTSILIWSDSFNTVALFNSLHATSNEYNTLLKTAIDSIITHSLLP